MDDLVSDLVDAEQEAEVFDMVNGIQSTESSGVLGASI